MSAIPESKPSSVALHGVARPERREAIQKDRIDSMGLQLPPLSEGLLHGSEVKNSLTAQRDAVTRQRLGNELKQMCRI